MEGGFKRQKEDQALKAEKQYHPSRGGDYGGVKQENRHRTSVQTRKIAEKKNLGKKRLEGEKTRITAWEK